MADAEVRLKLSVTAGEVGQRIGLDVNQGWAGTAETVTAEVAAAFAALSDLIYHVVNEASAGARADDGRARPGGTTEPTP